MPRIFLSHSSEDRFPAIAIRDWLDENGWDDVFLDVDPANGIHAGERWERALYEHAARYEAVLFLISRAWLASDWCRREYELARKLNTFEPSLCFYRLRFPGNGIPRPETLRSKARVLGSIGLCRDPDGQKKPAKCGASCQCRENVRSRESAWWRTQSISKVRNRYASQQAAEATVRNWRRFPHYPCGLNPWLDEKNLLPGQLWKSEITQAIRESDCVLVCLSQTAVTKTGYIHKEIREALDRADEQPPGRIFLIPLRFEQCDVSERLREIHWVDYFEPDGYERLILAIAQIEKCLHQMSERTSEIRTVA